MPHDASLEKPTFEKGTGETATYTHNHSQLLSQFGLFTTADVDKASKKVRRCRLNAQFRVRRDGLFDKQLKVIDDAIKHDDVLLESLRKAREKLPSSRPSRCTIS
ncbi:MAG: hypothetical protein P1U40_14235 [Coxiellaceae bacterium]|nr:hypothetical protein [Coxiellaceae bacterium]